MTFSLPDYAPGFDVEFISHGISMEPDDIDVAVRTDLISFIFTV